MDFWILWIIIIVVWGIIIFLAWGFLGHGFDQLRHPNEWKNTGSSGEQIIFLELTKKLHVPENQILRNVYIPTKDGKTSEIDILLVSKKGLFVIECKNYAGHIYGDARRKNWLQYVGRKKNYFYNPLRQNRTHCENLKKYLKEYDNIPITSMVATITRGTWKFRNLGPDDYMLGYNCQFKNVYDSMSVCDAMNTAFKPILEKLTPLSRPGQEIVEKHIEETRKAKHR